MGGVGDVYYCDMKNFIEIVGTHKIKKFKLENFKFKWEENQINFGNDDNNFRGVILTINRNLDTKEQFRIWTRSYVLRFDRGDFFYTAIFATSGDGKDLIIKSISATCTKF